MSARKVIIGCSAVALVTVAFLVIGGIVAFKRLSAPAPLPSAVRLVDSECLGVGVARLEPEDPWVKGAIEQISDYSTRRQKPKEIFPLELVWTERRTTEGPERHIVSLSLSHGGRFLGLFGDLMLWRVGRQAHEKIARVEYGGEGITSFPGTSLPGSLFIRDNSFIWSSDLDTAKKAVDLLSHAAEENEGQPPTTPSVGVASMIPPGTGHALSGAIINENGSLSRSLWLVPGESLDVPAETLATVQHLTFALDTTSATDGIGRIVLTFAPGTPAGTIASVAQDLCVRLAAVPIAKVTIAATPHLEEARAVLDLKIGGLDSVSEPLLRSLKRTVRHVESFRNDGHHEEPEREQKEETPGEAKDPNQSSSTFQ